MRRFELTDERPPRGLWTLGALLLTAMQCALLALVFSVPLMALTASLDGWGRHEYVLPDGTHGFMVVCGDSAWVNWRTLPLYATAFLAVGYLAARRAAPYGARWVAPAAWLPHAAWAVDATRDMWDLAGEGLWPEESLYPLTFLYALFAVAAVVLPYVGARLGARPNPNRCNSLPGHG